MLKNSEILAIVEAEETASIGFMGEGSELARKRAKILEYYNQELFGDEVDGQSKAVTSDVFDVVEGSIPYLLRLYTQGRYVGIFDSYDKETKKEADQKTELSNHIFNNDNDGVMILRNMFHDAQLQYTGWVKVYVAEEDQVDTITYQNLDDDERIKATLPDNVEVVDVDKENMTVNIKRRIKRINIVNIPADEGLIAKDARDFDNPRFIGHRSPKTRSQLIEMGFDKEIVNRLPADREFNSTPEKNARAKHHNISHLSSEARHHPNDTIFLTECYQYIDVDGDGIAELWKIFKVKGRILDKERADDHPFAVAVPIPIPHQAIGTCIGEKALDSQYLHSTLLRQGLNNIYQSNYGRYATSDVVDLDALLTPRNGGVVEVETKGQPVVGHIVPLQHMPVVGEIMQMIEYQQAQREIRTGVTRYNQGLDTESLNKTATGFVGIKDMSEQRLEMTARIISGAVKRIFELIVKLAVDHRIKPEDVGLMASDIDPASWNKRLKCRIDVGIGSGDRKEQIANLFAVLQRQDMLKAEGSVLVDETARYNTLAKLVDAVGLKDPELYFNNPEVPGEIMQAMLELTAMQNQQLMAMLQNPLQAVEQTKQQGQLMAKQMQLASDEKIQTLRMMLEQESRKESNALELKKHLDNFLVNAANVEAKYKVDIPKAGLNG